MRTNYIIEHLNEAGESIEDEFCAVGVTLDEAKASVQKRYGKGSWISARNRAYIYLVNGDEAAVLH